jgi:hypothetical protein
MLATNLEAGLLAVVENSQLATARLEMYTIASAVGVNVWSTPAILETSNVGYQ